MYHTLTFRTVDGKDIISKADNDKRIPPKYLEQINDGLFLAETMYARHSWGGEMMVIITAYRHPVGDTFSQSTTVQIRPILPEEST